MNKISAVIITRDAAATLAQCLSSLSNFAEVIVYDNGSADESCAIATGFPNVRLVTGEFMGFGRTKQHAVALASSDWVFSIDADEHLSPELSEEITRLTLDESAVAYEVLRNNRMMGRHIRYAGWGNDWLVRLFNRTVCNFDSAPVHEKVVVPSHCQRQRLQFGMWHEAVTELNQFLVKIAYYSELHRQDQRPRHYPPAIVVFKAIWSFFRSYVLRLGLLEGWRGVVIATSDANGTFYKYIKTYADRAIQRESRHE